MTVNGNGQYLLGANERHVQAKVPVKLDPAQLEKGADEIASITSAIEVLEEEARSAASGFRKSIKEKKAERRVLVEERKSKKRLVDAQCVEQTNFPTSKIVWYPNPSHANAIKVSEMPLSPEELREPPLFNAGEKGKKGGGKRTKKPGAAVAPAEPEKEGAAASTH